MDTMMKKKPLSYTKGKKTTEFLINVIISSEVILALENHEARAKCFSQSELIERNFNQSATNTRVTFPALFTDYNTRLFLALFPQK